jgi:hypothetical protein
MEKLKYLALAIWILFAPSLVFAQSASIANLAPPGAGQGSTSLTFGDIVAATRGGVPGYGGGTTYGLLVGWGGACAAGSFVSTINSQGVPSCSFPFISNSTTFSVASGCGSVSSVTGGGTTGSFVAGQTGCVPVLTLPSAPNGWFCSAHDLTHPSDTFTQTGSSTTSCTLSATVTNGDTIIINASGF